MRVKLYTKAQDAAANNGEPVIIGPIECCYDVVSFDPFITKSYLSIVQQYISGLDEVVEAKIVVVAYGMLTLDNGDIKCIAALDKYGRFWPITNNQIFMEFSIEFLKEVK